MKKKKIKELFYTILYYQINNFIELIKNDTYFQAIL